MRGLEGFLDQRKLELSLEGCIRIIQKDWKSVPSIGTGQGKAGWLKTAWNMGMSYRCSLTPLKRVPNKWAWYPVLSRTILFATCFLLANVLSTGQRFLACSTFDLSQGGFQKFKSLRPHTLSLFFF